MRHATVIGIIIFLLVSMSGVQAQDNDGGPVIFTETINLNGDGPSVAQNQPNQPLEGVVEGNEGTVEGTVTEPDCQKKSNVPEEPYPSRSQIEKHVMGDNYSDGKADQWVAKYRQPVTYNTTQVTQVIRQQMTQEELEVLQRVPLEKLLKNAVATRGKDGKISVTVKDYPSMDFVIEALISQGNASVTSDGKIHLVESGKNAPDTLDIMNAEQKRGKILQEIVNGLRQTISGLKARTEDLEKRLRNLNLRVDGIEKTVAKMRGSIGLHFWWLLILTIILLWPTIRRFYNNYRATRPAPRPRQQQPLQLPTTPQQPTCQSTSQDQTQSILGQPAPNPVLM